MGITKENRWGNKTSFASLVLMLVCLFVSRAALSVSVMFFFALTIVDKSFFQQLRVFYHPHFLFSKVKRHTIFWYSLNAIVVFSFVFDMTIEAQFGVFIYAAIVLGWWKWLTQPGTHE
jgi:hypothetical protein